MRGLSLEIKPGHSKSEIDIDQGIECGRAVALFTPSPEEGRQENEIGEQAEEKERDGRQVDPPDQIKFLAAVRLLLDGEDHGGVIGRKADFRSELKAAVPCDQSFENKEQIGSQPDRHGGPEERPETPFGPEMSLRKVSLDRPAGEREQAHRGDPEERIRATKRWSERVEREKKEKGKYSDSKEPLHNSPPG